MVRARPVPCLRAVFRPCCDSCWLQREDPSSSHCSLCLAECSAGSRVLVGLAVLLSFCRARPKLCVSGEGGHPRSARVPVPTEIWEAAGVDVDVCCQYFQVFHSLNVLKIPQDGSCRGLTKQSTFSTCYFIPFQMAHLRFSEFLPSLCMLNKKINKFYYHIVKPYYPGA